VIASHKDRILLLLSYFLFCADEKGKKRSDVYKFILTSIYAQHMGSSWYIPDLLDIQIFIAPCYECLYPRVEEIGVQGLAGWRQLITCRRLL